MSNGPIFRHLADLAWETAKDQKAEVAALASQAQKHAEHGQPLALARKYLAACELEGPAIQAAFPEHVFLTYNGPDADPVLPDLPRMYVYSTKRGTSVARECAAIVRPSGAMRG